MASPKVFFQRLLSFFRRPVLRDTVRSMYIPVVDPKHELDLAESIANLVIDDDALSDIYTVSIPSCTRIAHQYSRLTAGL